MDLFIQFDLSDATVGAGEDGDFAAVYLVEGGFVVASAAESPQGSRYVGHMAGAEGVYGSPDTLTMGDVRKLCE